jgi:putative transposase
LGSQYVAVRYTQRLADAGALASVGSTGDSYDNALAEAFNSLFKAELVRNKGPWKGIDDLEIAVADGGTGRRQSRESTADLGVARMITRR